MRAYETLIDELNGLITVTDNTFSVSDLNKTVKAWGFYSGSVSVDTWGTVDVRLQGMRDTVNSYLVEEILYAGAEYGNEELGNLYNTLAKRVERDGLNIKYSFTTQISFDNLRLNSEID